jgi:hypothetical protein
LDQQAVSPDPGEDSTARLYRAALGGRRAEHYLSAFARFDQRGRSGTSWNAAAAGFNLAWLMYRGLWRAAAGFAVLMLLSALGAWALWQGSAWLPEGVKIGVTLAMVLVLLALSGLFGSAWLHAGVRRHMIAAVQRAATLDAACEALRAQASGQRRRSTWALIGLLMAGLLVIGMVWRGGTTALAPSRVTVPAQVAKPRPAVLPAPLIEPVAEPVEVPPRAEQAAALAPPVALPAASTGPSEPPVEAPPPAATAAPAVSRRAQARGYGVAVGMFAVPANAERAVAKLTAAGLPALADAIESARGPLTRVRVGPFDNRAQADAAADRVRTLKLEARVYAP